MTISVFTVAVVLTSYVGRAQTIFTTPIQGNLSIMPLPSEMQVTDGMFNVNQQTWIYIDSTYQWSFDPLEVFRTVFKTKSGYELREPGNVIPGSGAKNMIRIMRVSLDHPEGYKLSVNATEIVISASTEFGIFYGLQTLRQIMNMDAMPDANKERREWSVPCVEIADSPHFAYRGLHLDVSRHFMPLDFVRKYIDLLAFHKMNRFHWHLTDDQGWRIEIKQYPKLQEIAAWRDETLLGHYRETPDLYDGTRHGGYYTQEEIKEVVAYACMRGVTIIPEIEMPGHAQAALAAYPELGCTPGPFEVATTWGVFDDVFCPNEITFTFLQNVLDEVMALFPSPYIHIGGDECPKKRWKESSFCQSLMKEEGLKDEHELQSYFIRRIEKYLNSKGRNIIGWDEILEGGLAPNATVMSWRGVSGGIEAAQDGHDVIMTPGTHCYFDHYQADPVFEPIAIGGMTTLEKVYSFNPVPSKLTSAQAKYILGAQGNLWTEYIDSPAQAEYMAYPRAVALAEVLWASPDQKEWKGFIQRLQIHLLRLDGMKVNYAKHLQVPIAVILSDKEGLHLTWKTDLPGQEILFSRDTSIHTWEKAITGETSTFMAPGPIFYKTAGSGMKLLNYTPSQARTASISSSAPPSGSYPGRQGLFTLHDGLKGKSDFNGEDWCGWNGSPFTINITLEGGIAVDSIVIGLLSSSGSWIYTPQSIEIQGSTDLNTYKPIALWTPHDLPNGRSEISFKTLETGIKAIRLNISPLKSIPAGKPGAGHVGWTFIDEIAVY